LLLGNGEGGKRSPRRSLAASRFFESQKGKSDESKSDVKVERRGGSKGKESYEGKDLKEAEHSTLGSGSGSQRAYLRTGG